MVPEQLPGTAIAFPGMGPHRFTDLAKFLLINPFARELTATADDVLGYSLFDRYREAEGDYSEFAQVAFLVTCLALAKWAEQQHGIQPRYCAGASFGGKAAAAYAGALTPAEAIWLTARLARCEEEYFAREHPDVITQSIVRTPRDRLDEILADLDARGGWHEISCHVDDDFYMVSLSETRLDWFTGRVRAAGGMPLYTTRPPMHCRAFAPLRDVVDREICAGLRFADPRIPLIADQDGTVVTSAEGARTMLLDGLVRPVRWPEVVAALRRAGAATLYVSGPDRLFSRVACTTRNFTVVPLDPRAALAPRRRMAA